MAVAVRGLADVQKGLKNAERDVRLGVRKEMRAMAEPVKATAETFAVGRVSGIRRARAAPPRVGGKARVDWSRMRVGVTQKSVYVAPRQRGAKSGPQKRGQQFANLLADRAMDPTRERHAPQFEREMEQMLDRVCDKFNRGI